jgi:hypothetical protein
MYCNAPNEELTEEKAKQLREVQIDFMQIMYKINKLELPILIDFRIVEDKHNNYSDKFYIYLLSFKKTMRAVCGLSLETAFPQQYKELNYDFDGNKLYSQDL